MNNIKTFEAFVSEKDSAQVNENPMVAMAAMSAADKMKEAYDAMKENAMEIDGDESDNTAISEACEMMKENAAMAAMAAKELAEMMKEVHVPGHEDESNVAEGKVNELGPGAAAMAANALMKEMKEAFDASMEEAMKKEGAKEEIAAELISKELSK